MKLLNLLFGRPQEEDEIARSIKTLEQFLRALMNSIGNSLFEGETPARQALHAYAIGAISALAVQKHFSPEQGFDIQMGLLSRLFGCSADEARAWTKSLVGKPGDQTLSNDPAVNHGVAGFKHWQQHGIDEVAKVFEMIVTERVLCALCSGGNGESAANAVVVESGNSLVGVQAECAYIARQCGAAGQGWQRKGQRMHRENGRLFDVITVALSNGQDRTFYFDITQFFGR